MDAWLASTPYQGGDWSSRRSVVARNATQAPAVGPPRIIAAPTNGRWNVKCPAPSADDTVRTEPSRPNNVHSRTPPVVPASAVPSSAELAIAGPIGTVTV